MIILKWAECTLHYFYKGTNFSIDMFKICKNGLDKSEQACVFLWSKKLRLDFDYSCGKTPFKIFSTLSNLLKL